MADFAGALRAGDKRWNLICFVADAACDADLCAMLDLATKLLPGQSAEQDGRWCIRAEPLELRDVIVGDNGIQKFSPNWWPNAEPNFQCTSTVLGTTENPVVRLISLVPFAPYTNPVLRKASSRQSRSGVPYVIALDSSELPRAHERITKDLDRYFATWNHVSAVLIFEYRPWIGVAKKTWVISLHLNPAATDQVPHQLSFQATREPVSIDFVLSEASM
ncbi:MAG: hypothetical protein KA777_09625 [Rhodoferax sp.]|nr:hypothetical protein [Rhodoferax sp.]